MRIPSVLLLPVVVSLGACTQTVPSAIATGDRPAPSQPTIASPVATPLMIKSLAGTYKGVVDEKALKNLSSDLEKQMSSRLTKQGENVPVEVVEQLERDIRQSYEQVRITINSDSTFEARINFEQRGKVKLDGNKLIFTADSSKPIDGADGSTNTPKCSECCTFALHISADRKTLSLDKPSNPSELLRGYVKQ
ncbi:hypothetical protein H6F76_07945 [Leptolyngbya sp. FACHB-321]|uniref:hypothetical protein n=1 Tax=Leptolyngbya sp. FACHB-321 TaxID=2692807 RepID=UPI001681E931|nr:hypothetical protein [Leptolyngbya sp. FACHB-321]MBD2034961.1 hypothetical protein [Leptolyngbya sp. FACHB-321]